MPSASSRCPTTPASARTKPSASAKIGVLENMGFKAGAWHHTGWWQLELSPMPDQPQRPRSLTSLIELDILECLLGAGIPSLKENETLVYVEESE